MFTCYQKCQRKADRDRLQEVSEHSLGKEKQNLICLLYQRLIIPSLEHQPPRAEETCQRQQPRAHMQEWPVQC